MTIRVANILVCILIFFFLLLFFIESEICRNIDLTVLLADIEDDDIADLLDLEHLFVE
jgi:hypothetical protein